MRKLPIAFCVVLSACGSTTNPSCTSSPCISDCRGDGFGGGSSQRVDIPYFSNVTLSDGCTSQHCPATGSISVSFSISNPVNGWTSQVLSQRTGASASSATDVLAITGPTSGSAAVASTYQLTLRGINGDPSYQGDALHLYMIPPGGSVDTHENVCFVGMDLLIQ